MKTIIDTATDAGRFTTLLHALTAASMTDTLRTAGPYTLFAPSDEAFKRLAPGALAALLQDTTRLHTVLACHVVPGVVAAKDLAQGDIKSVAGTSLVVTRHGGEVFLNGVAIVRPDIAASNGVIHVVEAVIVPLGTKLSAAA